jgi:phage terminase large subunit
MSIASRLPPDMKHAALKAALRRIKRKEGVHEGEESVRKFQKYYNDPVGFARNELKVKAWHRQADLLNAAAAHPRVLCRSGHKCGKSLACVILALWWVATRPSGRVVLTAPTGHQIKDILWRELRIWYPKVKAALGGVELPKDPGTGLQLPGGREIVGISTKQPENLAGISGSELLFIIDEASGFPDELFDVVRGNSAGGAKIIAISNPTRTVGWFFEGFRKGTYDVDSIIHKPHVWRLLHISSEESPNVVANDNGGIRPANDNAVKGLATCEWLEEMREDCGPDYEESAIYLVRARGDFPTQGTDSIIGYRTLRDAEKRWQETDAAKAHGTLCIGVDVSRFGDDETILQPVRGDYAWPCSSASGDGNEVAEAIVQMAVGLRRGLERVRVNVDGIGVGSSVVDALKVHPACREQRVLYVVDVNVGERADDAEHYINLRSQVWFGLAEWLKTGAVPSDERLESELLSPTYTFDIRNRKQVMAKKDIRKLIGRSPDRADALCLAVYQGRGAVTGGYQPAVAVEGNVGRFSRGGGMRGRRGGAL